MDIRPENIGLRLPDDDTTRQPEAGGDFDDVGRGAFDCPATRLSDMVLEAIGDDVTVTGLVFDVAEEIRQVFVRVATAVDGETFGGGFCTFAEANHLLDKGVHVISFE